MFCINCGSRVNSGLKEEFKEKIMIKFYCNNCNHQIEAKHIDPGEKIGCQNCGELNTVPSRDTLAIMCTKCHWTIDSETAEISKNYIKCQHCGYWEDIPNDNISNSTNAEEIDFICPHCETANNTDAQFCRKCGKKMVEQTFRTVKYCEKCESEYDENDEYCQNDGNKLSLKEIEIDPAELRQTAQTKDDSTQRVAPSNPDTSIKEVTEHELGFWLANLWIGLQTIGTLAWIALAFYLYDDSGEAMLFIIALFSIPSAVTAYGVYSRTKWGLYATYIYLVLFLATGMVKFFPENPILGGMQFIIATLWYVYFNKRSQYFI